MPKLPVMNNLTGMTFHWAPSKGSLAEMWDQNLEISKIQTWRSNPKKSLISISQIRSDYVDDLVDNYPSPVKHYDQVLTIMISKLLMSMSYLRIWPQSGWGAAPSLSASSCKCRRWHSCYCLGDFLWFRNWKNTKLKNFVLRLVSWTTWLSFWAHPLMRSVSSMGLN